ncbi:hypothetical protein E2C01_031491 [Portunus trituberculatus]|uniref:Uncharacterized protein n=1 Tax=Portunus trituberculatus TaxID=210409 RepID=A0A5B7EXS1_PORTR|nr:hypothetical protein [Portunus trituberculatus]
MAKHMVVNKALSFPSPLLPLSHSDTSNNGILVYRNRPAAVLRKTTFFPFPSPAAVLRKTTFFCILSVVFHLETYDGTKDAY